MIARANSVRSCPDLPSLISHQKIRNAARVQTAWPHDDHVGVDQCTDCFRDWPHRSLERDLLDASAASRDSRFAPNRFAALKLGMERHVLGGGRQHAALKRHKG